MTLDNYINHLETLRRQYGGDIPLKYQTLTHCFDAEIPIVRIVFISGKEVPFILVNP